MTEEEYEDYIAYTPQSFLMLDPQTYQIAKENGTIISALSEGNMSVKEIHDLYRTPDTKKHTKTLKTIYRYMDTLEKAGLVKIAGYRKCKNPRCTEKLYCRTARVFFNRDNHQKEQWLTTQEGQEYIESLTQVIWKINNPTTDPPPELKTHITTYFKETQIQVNKIIDKITTDEKLATILDKHKLSHIQNLLSITSHIQATLEIDTIDQLKKILEKN